MLAGIRISVKALLTKGRSIKIEWLVIDVSAVRYPVRAEGDFVDDFERFLVVLCRFCGQGSHFVIWKTALDLEP